jgi:hypothetical protein
MILLRAVLQNKMYTQFIHKTEQQCKEEPLDGGSGPTMQSDAQPALPNAQRLQPEAAVLSGADTEKAATAARRLRQWHDKPPLTYVSRVTLHTLAALSWLIGILLYLACA